MSTRRRAARIGAASLLLGALAWVSLAPAATTVRITQPDGDVVRVDVAEIDPADQDVGPDEDYVVDGERHAVTGISLGRLLGTFASVNRWQSVRVGPVTMTRHEYDEFGAATPPAFYAEQGDAVFIVPDRGGRSGEIVARAPSVVASDDLRTVRITPDNREIDAGERITFDARLSGGSAAGLRFAWSGTGLDAASGQSVTYRFPKKGSYGVQVTVTEGGEPVAADGTQVFVDPKPSDKDRTGGGKDEDEDAPDTGRTQPGPGSSTPSGSSPSGLNPTSPGTSPESAERTPAPPAADPDVEVAGDLLAETAAIAPEEQEERTLRLPAVREGTPRDHSELGVSGAAFAAGIVALLFGLGAGRELERLRPRRWLARIDASGLRRRLLR